MVTSPDLVSGRMTVRKACQRVQPATSADSSSEAGTSAKKALISQIANGRLKVR